MAIIHGRSFLERLIELGVVPPDVRRVIIDAHKDRVPIVYVEQVGTNELLLLEPTDLKEARVCVIKDAVVECTKQTS